MSGMTRDQAARILSPVPHGERLRVVRMAMPSGMHGESLCSMEEVHWFLEPSLRTLPGIRLESLAAWIEDHFGDQQTAEAIVNIVTSAPSQVEACRQTWELVGARLAEAREVLHG